MTKEAPRTNDDEPEAVALPLPGFEELCRGRGDQPELFLDRMVYVHECEQRWSRMALADAKSNWNDWDKWTPALQEAMKLFKRDPLVEVTPGNFLNGSGQLINFLWMLQDQWQPDKGCLRPLLDFCDRYQSIFLRRGLVIYCQMILRHIEAAEPALQPAHAMTS